MLPPAEKKDDGVSSMPRSFAASSKVLWCQLGTSPPVPRLLVGYRHRMTECCDIPVISATALRPPNFWIIEFAGSRLFCIPNNYENHTIQSI